MTSEFAYTIKTLRFDEDYIPADNTRITTNFANLARGKSRHENLCNVLKMIDNRFNVLVDWDNRTADRYKLELDIVSASVTLPGQGDTFPLIEILKTWIIDQENDTRIEGIVGNNFSSYVRDYDFSVLLPEYNKGRTAFGAPTDFGALHGKLFKSFVNSQAYKALCTKVPVICLSVSSTKTYYRSDNYHPVLGVEYRQDAYSLTDEYFAQMGLKVRYFLPKGSVAPFAFYFSGDLLNDYTNLELASTIATMDSFQRVYRPEIYNANSIAGHVYQPSLGHKDYSLTRIVYDREERSRLATEQGKFAQHAFITPNFAFLQKWSSNSSL